MSQLSQPLEEKSTASEGAELGTKGAAAAAAPLAAQIAADAIDLQVPFELVFKDACIIIICHTESSSLHLLCGIFVIVQLRKLQSAISKSLVQNEAEATGKHALI